MRFDRLNEDEVYRSTRIRLEGCSLNVNPESPDYGWVLCPPEMLRANAERRMRELGYWPKTKKLSLHTYSAARNIASEQGSGTVEMKACLALSTWGQAARGVRGKNVTEVILRNKLCSDGRNGSRCLYGRIHGKEGTSTAPFGRWTASSQDPSVVDILIADFVLSGGAGQPLDPGNFARGASNQAESSAVGVTSKAKYREYWVGPIPNVNPKKLMLMAMDKTIAPDSPRGLELIRRATDMKNGPEPDWRAEGGFCPPWQHNRAPSFAHKIATASVILGGAMIAGVAFATQIPLKTSTPGPRR